MNTTDSLQLALDILNKVDSTYTNAWNRLILVISVLGTLFGLLVPVLVAWILRLRFNADEERIAASANKRIEELGEGLKLNISTQFEKETQALEKTFGEKADALEKKLDGLQGKSLFLQAKDEIRSKRYATAASDLALAASYFLEANDNLDFRSALTSLTNVALNKITENEIMTADSGLEENVSNLLELLDKRGDDYYDFKLDLEKAWAEAQTRPAIPEDEKEKPA